MKRYLVSMLGAALLAAVLAPLPAAAQKIEVLWLGQSAVRITSTTGKVVMIDPYLIRNPKTPKKWKDLKALGKIDVILITHGHFDHTADVGALAKLVAERLEPEGGALLHIAGTHVAGDLAGLLAKAGFTVRRAVIYEAREADCISAELISMIEAGGIDVALFFSPRTAKSFVTLAFEAGVSSACEGVTALCLSAAVAREAETIAWNEVRVAAHPDLDGLLALIDEFRRDAGLGA